MLKHVFIILGLLLVACGTTAPTGNVSTRSGPIDACTLLKQAEIDAAFGRAARPGEHVADSNFFCNWVTKDNPVGTPPKLLNLQVFTAERLKADGTYKDAAAYYQYAGGAVGIAYNVPAEGVVGVGERAAWAGKDAGGLIGKQGQMFVLYKDVVFNLVAGGLAKVEVEMIAKQVIANY